jgi:capsular polysaccharide biosynthesis protein
MNFIGRRIIKVNPPVNFSRQDKLLFYPGEFDICETKVLTLKNVAVSAGGLCFRNGELIRESTQLYADKLPIFERSGLLQLKLNPTLALLDSDHYLLIHHPWSGNYYHWFTEAIPRIWQVKNDLASLVLVMPDHLMRLKFVQESIASFNFKNIVTVPGTHNLKIVNAVIPQMKPKCYSYDPVVVKEIAAHFENFVKSKSNAANSTGLEYAYIIRGKSHRREIANEDEVIRKLNEFNVAAIDAREHSFIDQVALSGKLKLLISNGSGLTNMLFMKENSTVLELHKTITNMNDFHDKVLWHLASVLGLKYFHQWCEPVDPGKDMYIANLKVDIASLEKNVAKCLKSVRDRIEMISR